MNAGTAYKVISLIQSDNETDDSIYLKVKEFLECKNLNFEIKKGYFNCNIIITAGDEKEYHILDQILNYNNHLYHKTTKRYAYVIDPIQNNNNLREGYVEVTDCCYYENLEDLLNKLYSDLQ